MALSAKLILCLAVVVCVIQTINARPHFDGSYFENVKFDLTKKCMGVERDIEKTIASATHKIKKESAKLMRKAAKEGSPECVESARQQAEETLEERSEEALSCVRELRESLDTAIEPDWAIKELYAFRAEFKNKLSACKNSGKQGLKAIEKEFSATGKACLY